MERKGEVNMEEKKICKYCKSEIPKGAKICPNCRKKQKGPLGIIIAVVAIFVLIGAIAGGGSDSKSETASSDSNTSTTLEKTNTDEATAEENIEYIPCTKQELSDALQANAMKASETYKGQYLEISGYLDTIDSSGKYISINAGADDWSLVNVQCYIKNDEQKAVIMELSKGDAIVIKGKCTDVGELMGYSIDIDEVIAE